MQTNRLEGSVQEYWKVSRAWKRDPLFLEGQTYSTIMDRLRPFTVQGEFHRLRTQAEDLMNMIVHGKIRRKKGTIRGKVVHVDFAARLTSQKKAA